MRAEQFGDQAADVGIIQWGQARWSVHPYCGKAGLCIRGET
jgi:hypothetical protein